MWGMVLLACNPVTFFQLRFSVYYFCLLPGPSVFLLASFFSFLLSEKWTRTGWNSWKFGRRWKHPMKENMKENDTRQHPWKWRDWLKQRPSHGLQSSSAAAFAFKELLFLWILPALWLLISATSRYSDRLSAQQYIANSFLCCFCMELSSVSCNQWSSEWDVSQGSKN